jgi:hypothetical protein
VQHVGDLKYTDTNGDGVITDADRTIVGHNYPNYAWGITNRFNYKNISLSIFMNGVWGNNLLDISASAGGQSRQNQLKLWLHRWKSIDHPGSGKIPTAVVTDNLTTASTLWMRDASYFQIKNITLSYKFPPKILSKINGFSNLRIYFSVENVALFDHIYGPTPEMAAFQNTPLTPGVTSTNAYPIARTFTLGLNLKFK